MSQLIRVFQAYYTTLTGSAHYILLLTPLYKKNTAITVFNTAMIQHANPKAPGKSLSKNFQSSAAPPLTSNAPKFTIQILNKSGPSSIYTPHPNPTGLPLFDVKMLVASFRGIRGSQITARDGHLQCRA